MFFTLSWKVLNWSFMIICSATVPSTATIDCTSPAKLARAILPGWFSSYFRCYDFYFYCYLFNLFIYSVIVFWITPKWDLICGGNGIFYRQSFLDFRLFHQFLIFLVVIFSIFLSFFDIVNFSCCFLFVQCN